MLTQMIPRRMGVRVSRFLHRALLSPWPFLLASLICARPACALGPVVISLAAVMFLRFCEGCVHHKDFAEIGSGTGRG